MELGAFQDGLAAAVMQGLTAAIKDKLTSQYGNPLGVIIEGVLAANNNPIRQLLLDAVAEAFRDENWKRTVKEQTRAKLGKHLVEKFGGEVEKQVNLLKSDPTTRAKITLAIDKIVRGEE